MNNGLEDLSTSARSNLSAMSWNMAAYRMLELILGGLTYPTMAHIVKHQRALRDR